MPGWLSGCPRSLSRLPMLEEDSSPERSGVCELPALLCSLTYLSCGKCSSYLGQWLCHRSSYIPSCTKSETKSIRRVTRQDTACLAGIFTRQVGGIRNENLFFLFVPGKGFQRASQSFKVLSMLFHRYWKEEKWSWWNCVDCINALSSVLVSNNREEP